MFIKLLRLLLALGLTAGIISACGTAPRTVTYRFAYEVNVHDETTLGYYHLFDTIGVTVDPTGYITNMTSSLSSTAYGFESAGTAVVPEGDGTTYVGPTGPDIKNWTTYLGSDSSWALVGNYGLWHLTYGHCHWHVNFAVQSGGGVTESVVYPLWTWSGSCSNNQTLSTVS